MKLGLRWSHLTVRKVLRWHGVPPASRRGQRSCREFVRQHADQILAIAFFTVDRVWLTRLCALFLIEVGSRRVVARAKRCASDADVWRAVQHDRA